MAVILITGQDSPGAPKNEDVREHPKDIVEIARKDIAIGNDDLVVTDTRVYPVKDKPTVSR
ncbi:MAG: hypothetical protein M1839_007615 [Geoglossum umbratile]|nr:MAG: hypothetical protein M1839_007615 [Geoglossum umbratile]